MKPRVKFAAALTVGVAILALLGSTVLWLPVVVADETGGPAMLLDVEAWKWGLLAAAIATGASSIAAAYAVASIGTAAMGTLAEKPELFGRLLIFLGLAEGIAIYGLIISILILNRLV